MNRCGAHPAGVTRYWARTTMPAIPRTTRRPRHQHIAMTRRIPPLPPPPYRSKKARKFLMSVTQPAPAPHSSAKEPRPFKLIGELINNSFARAAKAFKARDVTGFQKLAKLQADMGASFITLNIDGTQTMMVKPQEMFDFLPDLIPAIQEVTSIPMSFDNPSIEFHKRCLKFYDRSKSGRPILNSVAASRTQLDDMLALAKDHDTNVIGMASEKFNPDGSSGQCLNADDVYNATVQL